MGDVDASVRVVFCVVARDRQYAKHDEKKVRCPASWNYCSLTINALREGGFLQAGDMKPSHAQTAIHAMGCDQRLAGVILADIACKQLCHVESRTVAVHAASNLYKCLYGEQVAVLKVTVREAIALPSQVVHVSGAFQGKAATLLAELTGTSFEALSSQIDGTSGNDMRHVLTAWKEKYGDIYEKGATALALSVPCGHALLLTCGAWTEYALPCLPSHQRRKTGPPTWTPPHGRRDLD
eukprot:1446674-Amphidinium_carterae.1